MFKNVHTLKALEIYFSEEIWPSVFCWNYMLNKSAFPFNKLMYSHFENIYNNKVQLTTMSKIDASQVYSY